MANNSLSARDRLMYRQDITMLHRFDDSVKTDYRFKSIVNFTSNIFLVVSSVLMSILALTEGALPSLLIYFITGILGLAIVYLSDREGVMLYKMGYGIGCTASVLLYFIYISRFGVPYYSGGSDDLNYENEALITMMLEMAYDSESIAYAVGNTFHNSVGYIYFLSLLMRLGDVFGGYNTIMPRIVNSMMLGLIAVFVYNIAQKINLNRRRAMTAGLWVLFFPIMVYTSSHVFRDTITLLILLFALYLALTINTKNYSLLSFSFFSYAILFSVLFLFMMQLRMPYVIPMAAMMISGLIIKFLRINQLRAVHFFGFLLFASLLFYLLKDDQVFIKYLDLINIYAFGFSSGQNSSDDGLSLILFNLPQPLQTFARVFYSILTPLPVYHSNIELNLLSIGTIIQFFYFPFVFLGVIRLYKVGHSFPLIIGFFAIYFSYVYGTFTFRHITQWFPFAVLIGLIGYDYFPAFRRSIFVVCFILFFVFVLSYAFLKLA